MTGSLDPMTPEERSDQMALVRSKDTKPEMVVRKLVHGMGYRYRLHNRHLPGAPDLVFGSRKKVIFIHGCFWHRHPGCRKNRTPKSRLDYWIPKLQRNDERDAENQNTLKNMGWEFLIIWECETRDVDHLRGRIEMFLASTDS